MKQTNKAVGKGRTVVLIMFVAAALTGGWFALGGAPGIARRFAELRGGATSSTRSVGTANGSGGQTQESSGLFAAKALSETPTIETTGNLEPARAVDLSFSVAGTVTEVFVREGSRVAAGQALVALDDRSARYKVAEAAKRLLSAQVSGNESEAALIALEKELREADLEATVLKAPFAGIVTAVEVEAGETISAQTKAARVLDRSSLKAVLEIDEIDLPLVKAGQRVVFTFDALPGREYEGRITLIPEEGTVTSQGLAVFEVEATIASPPAELKPGYSFVAKVAAANPKTVVLIPSSSIITRNGVSTVLVAKGPGERPESRTVVAVKRADGMAEVSQGLSAGELVVVRESSSSSGNRGMGAMGFMIPGMGGPPPGEGGAPSSARGGQQGSSRQGIGGGSR